MKDGKLRAAIAENPALALFLGACPALGATESVLSALGMSAAVIAVLLLSTALISLLRRTIPESARVPAYVLIIAGFASAVQLLMNAFLPGIYQMLGVYLAVLAVDLMMFSGAEDAGEHGGAAIGRSLLNSLGFAALILVMAAVRELLGSGSFAGIAVPFFEAHRISTLTQASGGFIVFAFLLAAVSAIHPAASGGANTIAAEAAGLAVRESAKEGE